MSVSRRYSSRGYNPAPLYRDLIETQTLLEKLRAEQPRVAEHFDVWSKHRKSTIDTVDSLKNKIDALCVGCNVVRGVGAAVGIAGLLAGLIGAVLDANEHESASQFKEASKYCTGAGIVISIKFYHIVGLIIKSCKFTLLVFTGKQIIITLAI